MLKALFIHMTIKLKLETYESVASENGNVIMLVQGYKHDQSIRKFLRLLILFNLIQC